MGWSLAYKGRKGYIDQVNTLISSYLPIFSSPGAKSDYGIDIQTDQKLPLDRWQKKSELNTFG